MLDCFFFSKQIAESNCLKFKHNFIFLVAKEIFDSLAAIREDYGQKTGPEATVWEENLKANRF